MTTYENISITQQANIDYAIDRGTIIYPNIQINLVNYSTDDLTKMINQ